MPNHDKKIIEPTEVVDEDLDDVAGGIAPPPPMNGEFQIQPYPAR